MASTISDTVLDQLFRSARSQNGWLDRPVSDDQLKALYDLMKWGPTSMNCQPMRLLFLRTPDAKQRLKPALSPGNVDKTMAAPVCAVLGYDVDFAHQLPKNFPHAPEANKMFLSNEALNQATAFRNATLQGGYFMVAARAMGLDVGPMSGFDAAKVEAEFWPGTRIKANFLCNLGYGDSAKVMGRLPRYTFDEACKLL
jgi:3-hydroxypropanoate dehydrogenase